MPESSLGRAGGKLLNSPSSTVEEAVASRLSLARKLARSCPVLLNSLAWPVRLTWPDNSLGRAGGKLLNSPSSTVEEAVASRLSLARKLARSCRGEATKFSFFNC